MKNDWWKKLSPKEQKEYLKSHPGSKLKVLPPQVKTNHPKPNVKKPDHKADREAQLRRNIASEVGKRPDPSALNKALKYSEAKAEDFPQHMEPTLQNMKKTYGQRLKTMSEHQRRKLIREIRSAVKLQDRSKIAKATKKISIMTGIITVGAVGLSLATGVDMTIAMEAMAAGFWEDIADYANRKELEKQETLDQKVIKKSEAKSDKHQEALEEDARRREENRQREIKEREEKEFLQFAGNAYVDKIGENLHDPKKINDALVQDKDPDVVIDDKEEQNEAASIMLTSNHESDLAKAIAKIEKLEVAAQTDSILSSPKFKSAETAHLSAHKLINHIEMIETAIPSIASVFVASISQKNSLANRAKTQLSIFNRELARCREELAALGTSASSKFKRSPLAFFLKKNIKHEQYKYEVAYVKCEENAIRMCELHTFGSVDVAGFPVNKVEIFSYMNNADLNIAVTKDSYFMPKAFNVVKPREIASWLVENGVSA